MADEKNETTKTGNAPEGAEGDVQSDPAKDDGAGDWSGEGGATESGPATDSDHE